MFQKIINTKKKVFQLKPELLKKTLPAISFLNTIFFFIPIEPLLVFYIVKYKIKKYFQTILQVTIFTVFGGIIIYFFGYLILHFLPNIASFEYYEKLKYIIQQSFIIQFIFILIASTVSLIPFFALAFFAGILNIPLFLIFIPAIFIGRFLRFYIIAFISERYGQKTFKFFFRKKKWYNKD